MKQAGSLKFKGLLGVHKISAEGPNLYWKIKNNLRFQHIKTLIAVMIFAPLARTMGLFVGYGKLTLRLIKSDGQIVNYGVVGYRLVTNAFNQFLVDQFQAESSEVGDFKFHDSGVGTTAENAADTDIETTDGEARVAGTQTEGDPDEYVSVGTITYGSALAITEHGLFSQLTGGTLLDRTVFAAVNVGVGDSIEFTYTLALAGS